MDFMPFSWILMRLWWIVIRCIFYGFYAFFMDRSYSEFYAAAANSIHPKVINAVMDIFHHFFFDFLAIYLKINNCCVIYIDSISMFTRVYQDVPGCTRVYQGVPKNKISKCDPSKGYHCPVMYINSISVFTRR